MPQIKLAAKPCPVPSPSARDALTEVRREGARKLLAAALSAEAEEYLQQFSGDRDPDGHRLAVRNGFMSARTILTGIGPVEVRQPRVEDQGLDEDEGRRRFRSQILPPYLRKTKAVEELIPWLYLKGVSTGDFSEALAALLGPEAKGLSATTVTRLKKRCAEDFKQWNHRSLQGKRYVYFWVDGVYFNVRLEEDPGLRARHYWRHRGWYEGTGDGPRRLPGERNILARSTGGPEAPGVKGTAQPRDR